MSKKPNYTGSNKAKSRLDAILSKAKSSKILKKSLGQHIRPIIGVVLLTAAIAFAGYTSNIREIINNNPSYHGWQKSSHGQMLSSAYKDFHYANPSVHLTYIDVESIAAKGLRGEAAANLIMKQLETSLPSIFHDMSESDKKQSAAHFAKAVENMDHPFQQGFEYPRWGGGSRFNSLADSPDTFKGITQKWHDQIRQKAAIIVMSSGARTTSQLMLHNLARVYDTRYVLNSPPDFDQIHDNIIIHETTHGFDFFSPKNSYDVLHGESFADALAMIYMIDKYGPNASYIQLNQDVRVFSALTRRADHYTAPTVIRTTEIARKLYKTGELAKMDLNARAKLALKITRDTIIPEDSYHLLEEIQADFKTRFAAPNKGDDIWIASHFLGDASPEKAEEIANYYLSIDKYALDGHVKEFLESYPASVKRTFKKASPEEAATLYEAEIRALIKKRGYNENMRELIFIKAERFAEKLDMATKLRGDKSQNPYRMALDKIEPDYIKEATAAKTYRIKKAKEQAAKEAQKHAAEKSKNKDNHFSHNHGL